MLFPSAILSVKPSSSWNARSKRAELEKETRFSLPEKLKPEQISSVPRKITSKSLSSDRIILFNHSCYLLHALFNLPSSILNLNFFTLIIYSPNQTLILLEYSKWLKQEFWNSWIRDLEKPPIEELELFLSILMASVEKVLITSSNFTPSLIPKVININTKTHQNSNITASNGPRF